LGVKYLNELIARCRNYLNRVSLILQEISREKRDISTKLRAEESSYQVSFDELLANDERVKKLPNITDRTATANMLLRDERNRIEILKQEVQDLEYIEKVVRHRHNELKSTNTDIKMQRQMLRDELDTGAFYGDETNGPNGTTRIPRPKDDDLGESEIEAILRGDSIAGPAIHDDEDKSVPNPPAPTAVEVSVEEENAVAIQEALKASVSTPTLQEPVKMSDPPKEEGTSADEAAIEQFLSAPAKKSVEEDDDLFKSLGELNI
jgi:hypothetical protein